MCLKGPLLPQAVYGEIPPSAALDSALRLFYRLTEDELREARFPVTRP